MTRPYELNILAHFTMSRREETNKKMYSRAKRTRNNSFLCGIGSGAVWSGRSYLERCTKGLICGTLAA